MFLLKRAALRSQAERLAILLMRKEVSAIGTVCVSHDTPTLSQVRLAVFWPLSMTRAWKERDRESREELSFLVVLNYSAFVVSHKDPATLHFRSVLGDARSSSLIDVLLEVTTDLFRPSIGSETRIGGLQPSIRELASSESLFRAQINRLCERLQQKLLVDDHQLRNKPQGDRYSPEIHQHLGEMLKRLHPLSLR